MVAPLNLPHTSPPVDVLCPNTPPTCGQAYSLTQPIYPYLATPCSGYNTLGSSYYCICIWLSGQLCLGVVHINSRKAKYLLDDCNKALLKIKIVCGLF